MSMTTAPPSQRNGSFGIRTWFSPATSPSMYVALAGRVPTIATGGPVS